MNSCRTERRAMNKSRGVTLIELMVVVALIAILAAIAMPAYQNYVIETRRKVAQSQMVQLSASLERFFSDTNTYQNFPLGTAAGDLFPNFLPIEVPFATRHYDLGLLDENANGGSNPTAFGYTIVATPRAGGPQDGDGFMTLNSMGVKGHDADNSGGISAAEQKWED